MRAWKKRIEALELDKQQRECEHSYRELFIRDAGRDVTVDVSSECIICGKSISRIGSGDALEAYKTLRKFVVEAK